MNQTNYISPIKPWVVNQIEIPVMQGSVTVTTDFMVARFFKMLGNLFVAAANLGISTANFGLRQVAYRLDYAPKDCTLGDDDIMSGTSVTPFKVAGTASFRSAVVNDAEPLTGPAKKPVSHNERLYNQMRYPQ